ncbi:Flagellar biosynthesis protein FlhA C-terminal domain protein [Candidatus Cyrtobacter comes]|uniref:Flagellar biosynthesis protein FlhA C-terminal domain protein n=2 Tax=Candidatus Cyrtobacter comes TaxID=675776 RepID=A0ABU5L861_9RICK|nr:Flagellar biosynthesis protein FlhA C-terminal domain protein [Candidatus Cyrtobacter comes]
MASEIIPSKISVIVFQRILQVLLSESISIRDISGILEGIAEFVDITTNIRRLTEQVRLRLAKQICHANTSEKGYIPIVMLSKSWEQEFSDFIHGKDEDSYQLVIPPSKLQSFASDFNKIVDRFAFEGESVVLLTSAKVRPFIRSVVERIRPSVSVMSQNEIHTKAKIRILGDM